MSPRDRPPHAPTREQRLERIWKTVADIPPGSVASYGQVAEIAGIPRGARQVGRAAGTLAFDKGTPAFEKQKRLLAEDGVPVTNGRIDMQRYRWQPDLDELLWKPGPAWDENR